MESDEMDTGNINIINHHPYHQHHQSSSSSRFSLFSPCMASSAFEPPPFFIFQPQLLFLLRQNHNCSFLYFFFFKNPKCSFFLRSFHFCFSVSLGCFSFFDRISHYLFLSSVGSQKPHLLIIPEVRSLSILFEKHKSFQYFHIPTYGLWKVF